MDVERVVRDAWDLLSSGDVESFGRLLSPDARWLAVEEGPWNCAGRAAILQALGDRRQLGALTGEIASVTPAGSRIVVGFRPAHHAPDAWPLDDGVRYVVISVLEGLVVEMKGCSTRLAALAYATRPAPTS